MAQALYRKYRSKSLDTVVGQEHITTTLAHALKSGKLAHAYLFTGPRGVGKTSIARILAHEINGLPYEDDSSHLDIIEIDAASNRRIDEIRELRDKVNIAPAQARYKVYIIDEVHMLTREAFNALLKTLEEPPAHAVFILATTESHKLPETIVSRTQRFMFKPVDQAKVTAHLKSLAKSEKIAITDEALEMIAAHGEGSFRDSISLLDQTRGYSGSGKVDADYVRQLIGQPTDEAISTVVEALARNDAAMLTLTMTGLREQGFAAPQVAKRLGQRLRADILQGTIPHGVFELLQKLLTVPSAHDPESYLELILLENALAGQMAPAPVAQAIQVAAQPARTAAQPTAAAPAITAPAIPAPAPAPKTVAAPKSEPTKAATETPKKETPISLAPPAPEPPTVTAAPATVNAADAKPLDEMTWPQVLDCLKKTHNSLYGIARMGRPEFSEGKVELYFKFAFHQKRLNEAKNRDVLLAAIRTTCGRDAMVQCKLEEKGASESETFSTALETAAAPTPAPAAASTAAAPVPVTDPATLAAINNIFGGAEVLGS